MTVSLPLIGIDFDGTIADTSDFKRRWVKENVGITVPAGRGSRGDMRRAGVPEDCYNDMLLVACDKIHTLAAEPCPGSISGIHQLSEVARLCIVTDRGKFNNWLDWCELWLAKHGIAHLLSHIFSTEFTIPQGSETTKARICADNSISVLVDDDYGNLQGSGTAVPVWYASGTGRDVTTSSGILRAETWAEVVLLCRGLTRRAI